MISLNDDKELLLERVLILAIYKKNIKISINTLLNELTETGVFKNLAESKIYLKSIKKKGFFENGFFTPLGLERVEEALSFFKA
jgi:hypothetical protein